jgi:phage tail protein X
MTQTYKTREGDTVDSIAWKAFGRVTSAMLRAVLEANPGLADRGASLPAGVDVVLPDMPAQDVAKPSVVLWK